MKRIDRKNLLNERLLRFIQMLLEVLHEGCAARSYGQSAGRAMAKKLKTRTNITIVFPNIQIGHPISTGATMFSPGKIIVYLMGKLSYTDVFNASHWRVLRLLHPPR